MKKKVHIVHFTSRAGGIEVLMPQIIENLPQYLFSVFLIRPPRSGDINTYKNCSIPITCGAKGNIMALIMLWWYGVTNRNDIFHLHNVGPYYTFVLRLAGVRNLVYSIRGTIYWKTPLQKFLRKLVWKVALSRKYLILANSNYSKECFLKYVAYKGNVQVLYNPIASERFSMLKRDRRGPSSKKIIYSGRLDPGKNMFRWLDLAREISRHFPEYTFHIYGHGKLKNQLEAYAVEIEIRDSVFFHGFKKDIENAYKDADLMIFLSEFESFGNVVVESVLCGTPVIAAAIPSMREIFADYPVFLVEMDNMWIKTILGKLNNFTMLEKQMHNATKDFQAKYHYKNHIKKLDMSYRTMYAKS